MHAGAAGMLLHMNGKFTMGKLKSSLFICGMLYFKLSGINVINIITKPGII
jgi:hypothetical protein